MWPTARKARLASQASQQNGVRLHNRRADGGRVGEYGFQLNKPLEMGDHIGPQRRFVLRMHREARRSTSMCRHSSETEGDPAVENIMA